MLSVNAVAHMSCSDTTVHYSLRARYCEKCNGLRSLFKVSKNPFKSLRFVKKYLCAYAPHARAYFIATKSLNRLKLACMFEPMEERKCSNFLQSFFSLFTLIKILEYSLRITFGFTFKILKKKIYSLNFFFNPYVHIKFKIIDMYLQKFNAF